MFLIYRNMKHIKLFENFDSSEIDRICKEYYITKYKINTDGSIDVYQDVYLGYKDLEKLPLKFNEVWGGFNCSNNHLGSLEGSPNYVYGSFYCSYNNLKNLIGCPTYVDGNFNCSYNNLTSLEDCPTYVDGAFFCHKNKLTNLDGIPKEIGDSFFCSKNNITSLIGCPNIIKGEFDCSENKLINLEGCPDIISNDFTCNNNLLISLDGFPKEVGRNIYCYNNPINNIIILFDFKINIYLDYQETFNFLRKDCKVVKHLLDEALKDFNEWYDIDIKLPEKIKGYTYI